MICVQGYIQDYDVARRGASATSELTQQSGSLTGLASDLGRACQKFVCTIGLRLFISFKLIHKFVCCTNSCTNWYYKFDRQSKKLCRK
jgi:hypothetical protein